jgi:polyisoprenoid-binding protein YceI
VTKPLAMLVLLGASLLAGEPGASRAADWKAVPAASKLEFFATFEGSPVPGAFKTFDARLSLDPEHPATGSLEVAIRVASADMGIADVNREIAGRTWFDYASFPQAEFRSIEMRRVAGDRYLARGTLTLKGVAQPVEVPFTFADAPGGAEMEGELTLKRVAFAIGTGEWAATNVIGPDVKVKFRVRLTKAG